MLIRMWMRTAVRKEVTSFGTFLRPSATSSVIISTSKSPALLTRGTRRVSTRGEAYSITIRGGHRGGDCSGLLSRPGAGGLTGNAQIARHHQAGQDSFQGKIETVTCQNPCRTISSFWQRIGREIPSFGGHNVVTYTLPKQADRAVLHSHRAIHDDPQTSHREDGDRSSSKSIDDVDPWHNHVGGWAGDGSRAQSLVGGRSSSWSLVGWMALIKSLCFLFLPHEMETRLFLQQLHFQQFFYLYAALSLILGVYLTYGGFRSESN